MSFEADPRYYDLSPLNSEILSFWQSSGKEIKNIYYMDVFVYEDEIGGIKAVAAYDRDILKYLLPYKNHKLIKADDWKTEEEMLRILKLKAFI